MPSRQKKPGVHERNSTVHPHHPQSQQNNLQGLLAAPTRGLTRQRINGTAAIASPAASHPHQTNGSPRHVQSATLSGAQEVLDGDNDDPSSQEYEECGDYDKNHFEEDDTEEQYSTDDNRMTIVHAKLEREAASRLSSFAPSSHQEAMQTSGQYASTCAQNPLRIDFPPAQRTSANVMHHQMSPPSSIVASVQLAKTILTACPLWDVIAILIILLQLPPTIVTIIHVLFSGLTFVTPGPTATSLANLPSMNEILLGAGGAPSLPVIAFLDLVVFLVFCFMGYQLKHFVLDLAQAIIAVSLGGAVASDGGSTRSVTACLSLISLSHVFRWRPARQMGLNLVWSGLTKAGLRPLGDLPPPLPDLTSHFHSKPHWLRSILGVHILTQGVVRMVRRYLLWKELEPPPASRRRAASDLVLSNLHNQPSPLLGNTDQDVAYSTATDGRHPGPSPAPAPAARESRERGNTSKKKRRRATQVRSQQPFWAALASTKVTFVKEYEQSQASNDNIELLSTDPSKPVTLNYHNLKNRVWFKGISATEISFGLCLSYNPTGSHSNDSVSESASLSEVIEQPFFIRLNGASWNSVKIDGYRPLVRSDEGTVSIWLGRISGLTAYSPYEIEFIRTNGGEEIHAASLITQPAPLATSSTEQVVVVPPPAPQTLRPSSPITTLKNSVQALDVELENAKNTLKKKRKDHRTATNSIQKELDGMSGRLNSTGNNDDRQRARKLQLEQTIRRLEDEVKELDTQVEEMGDVPSAEVKASVEQREQLQKVKELHRKSQRIFEDAKSQADRELEAAQTDNSNLQKTHQKLLLKQNKNAAKHDGLVLARQQGIEAHQRRVIERDHRLNSQRAEEQRMRAHIDSFDRSRNDMQIRTAGLLSQVGHLESLWQRSVGVQQQVSMGADQSVPTTPDAHGEDATRNGFPFVHSPFTNFQFPATQAQIDASANQRNGTHSSGFDTAFPHNSPGNQIGRPVTSRHRSSSMLSGISGFTDDHVPDQAVDTYSSGSMSAFPPLTYGPNNAFPTFIPSYQPSTTTLPPTNGINASAPAFQPTSGTFVPAQLVHSSSSTGAPNSTSFSAMRTRRKSSQGSASVRGSRSLSTSSGSNGSSPARNDGAKASGKVNGGGGGAGTSGVIGGQRAGKGANGHASSVGKGALASPVSERGSG